MSKESTDKIILDAHKRQPELSNYILSKILGYSHTRVNTALQDKRIMKAASTSKNIADGFYKPKKSPEQLWAESGVRF